MLTLEAAGSVLLVCLGVGVLTVLCCAALIIARTHLAPHADCSRIHDVHSIALDELADKFKRRQKQAGGRSKAKTPEEPEEEEVELPALKPLTNFEKIKRANAASPRRLG